MIRNEGEKPPFFHAFIGAFSGFGPWAAMLTAVALSYKTIPPSLGICLAFIVNSLLTFLFYREDKYRAQCKYWRIPEKNLHWGEFLCGWPGALFAQQIFRHKRKKTGFMLVFFLCMTANIVMLFLFFRMKDSAAIRNILDEWLFFRTGEI